jgi:ABC-type xylose transport system permease subunit
MSTDQRLATSEPGDEVLDGLAPDEAPSAPATFWQRLSGNPNVAITLVALIVFAFFSVTTSTFLTEFNLINILRNAALIGILAVGMTYLLIAGEIDLSVGSVFGFLTVIMGLLVVVLELNPWLAMMLVIALGAVTGTINGLIRTRIGIPSFIVTLAMLVAYRSGALIASGERPLTTRVGRRSTSSPAASFSASSPGTSSGCWRSWQSAAWSSRALASAIISTRPAAISRRRASRASPPTASSSRPSS